MSAARRAERRRLLAMLRRARRQAKIDRHVRGIFGRHGFSVALDERIPPGKVYIAPLGSLPPTSLTDLDGWRGVGVMIGEVTFDRDPSDDLSYLATARQHVRIIRPS